MTADQFFEIISLEQNVFRFRFSGYLSRDVLEEYGRHIEAKYHQAIDSFQGKTFINYADLSGLKALSEEGKLFVAGLMTYAGERGLYHSININPSVLSMMAVNSAGKTSRTDANRTIVATADEAERLLAAKLKEIDQAPQPKR